MLKIDVKRQILLYWCIWFFIGNILLFWLIGLKYIPSMNWLFQGEYLKILDKSDQVALGAYLLFAYLGYIAFLAFFPAVFISFLLLVFPNTYLILGTSILLALTWVSLLLADTIAYSLFHFHINGIILDYLINIKALQVILNLSTREIISIGIGILVLFIIEVIWAIWLWYKLHNYRVRSISLLVFSASMMGTLLLISCAIYIVSSYTLLREGEFANRNFKHALIEVVRLLPLYNKLLNTLLPVKNANIALDRVFERKFVQPKQSTSILNYPLQTLQFKDPQKHLNILMIVIDAWRFDMLNEAVMPNIYHFSKNAWIFKEHFSGGNSTAAGIFSIFYSLPASYWAAMRTQEQGPVFIEKLLEQQYQMHVLASAGLRIPAFNRTIFQKIPNLQTIVEGENPFVRDQVLTNSFKHFLNDRVKSSDNNKAFFGFLFYNSPHGYCELNNNLQPFTPVIENCNRFEISHATDPVLYFNRYKNALHLIDKEVKEIIEALKAHQQLENTVVIITSDHGEEFNDNKQGYFGHASNFTRYQTQIPLIVFWPGEKPKTFDHKTTHYDIVPTLMQKALGSQTNPRAYSIGKNLLQDKSQQQSPYLIIGSYIGLGVVEADRITSIYPSGEFQICGLNSQPITGASIRISIMQSVFEDLRRFYRAENLN